MARVAIKTDIIISILGFMYSYDIQKIMMNITKKTNRTQICMQESTFVYTTQYS